MIKKVRWGSLFIVIQVCLALILILSSSEVPDGAELYQLFF